AESSVGRPMTQQGPGYQQFRPWDLDLQFLDKEFYVAATVAPGSAENPSKVTAKVSYQRSPNEAWQSETIMLDEAKYHDYWVAFKIDCDSGNIEWIKRYHTSISSYLQGDPEEETPQPENQPDDGESQESGSSESE